MPCDDLLQVFPVETIVLQSFIIHGEHSLWKWFVNGQAVMKAQLLTYADCSIQYELSNKFTNDTVARITLCNEDCTSLIVKPN